MALSPELASILVCPEDKGPLWYFADESTLYNERSKRRYQVRNENIPVLLIDDSETVDGDEHARLIEKTKSSAVIKTGPPDVTEDNK